MNEANNKNLVHVERLYDAGDYKEARRVATLALASDELGSEERQRLEAVLRATSTDKVAILIMLGTLGLLVYLVIKYAF